MMQRTKDAITPVNRTTELPTIFREVDRWFDDLRRDFNSAFWTPLPAFELDGAHRPLVDLKDTGQEFVVTAEVPGVSKDDIEITVTPEALEVRAKAKRDRDEEKEDFVFRERAYAELARTISLPAEVRPEAAEASLRDGVLEIRLPKKEVAPAVKPLKVAVK